VTNLELPIGQFILGASQRSAHERAGSHCRLRFSFISRYHKGRQGYPVNGKNFNVSATYFKHERPNPSIYFSKPARRNTQVNGKLTVNTGNKAVNLLIGSAGSPLKSFDINQIMLGATRNWTF
jgi:hypothetical protein